MRKGPKPADPVARFWSHVDKNGPTQPHMTSPCWVWTGSDAFGYGTFAVGSIAKGGSRRRTVRAHRFAYENLVGPIPEGLGVLHRCDHRRCVRTDGHLFLGTRAENMADMSAKGRTYKGYKLSHEEVRSIRATHGLSTRKLAALYGVSKETVRRIVRGETYRHVD